MTYRISSNSFCSTINSRNSFMPFLFGLSSTAKTLWLTFQKIPKLVSASRAVFPFLRGIKTGKRKMGSSCPRGQQSERSIHFILPTGAACHMVTGDIPQFSNLSVNHDKSLPLKCIQDERMFCDRYRRRDIFVFSLIRNREH